MRNPSSRPKGGCQAAYISSKTRLKYHAKGFGWPAPPVPVPVAPFAVTNPPIPLPSICLRMRAENALGS